MSKRNKNERNKEKVYPRGTAYSDEMISKLVKGDRPRYSTYIKTPNIETIIKQGTKRNAKRNSKR